MIVLADSTIVDVPVEKLPPPDSWTSFSLAESVRKMGVPS
jgi:hypothetical protein